MKNKKGHSKACLEANQGVGKNEGFTCTDNCLDKPQHPPTPLKLTYDGKGLNDANNIYKERVATLSGRYATTQIGEAIERAVNAYEKDQEIKRELIAAANRVRSVLNDEGKEVLTKAEMEDILFKAIAKAEGK